MAAKRKSGIHFIIADVRAIYHLVKYLLIIKKTFHEK
jgi:hypothetical protein